MGRNEAERRAVVERDGDGPVQQAMAEVARELGLWIVAGTQPIAVTGDSRPANACVVYDAQGKRAARYDKIHLFDVDLPGGREGYRESANATPGARAVLVDTPAGRLGLTVCYDLRFPELYRQLVSEGAEIFSIPAAFTGPTGRAHWETLLRARAIEDLCFVIAAAQSGIHDSNRETYGDTLIADYWGRVLAREPRGSHVVVGSARQGRTEGDARELSRAEAPGDRMTRRPAMRARSYPRALRPRRPAPRAGTRIRCSAPASTRATSISSSRARSTGRSRTASSRKAATASSRAWACGPWPASAPALRIRTRSCRRRCSRRRAPRARSRARAARARCRPGTRRRRTACTRPTTRSQRSPTWTRWRC